MTKHLLAIALLLSCITPIIAAEKEERKESPTLINGLSVSPYYTIGFQKFDESAKAGVGLDIGLNLSKTVQAVTFLESDDPEHSFVDRFGLGLQMTGKLGRWLKPYARLSGGHVFDSSGGLAQDSFFLRPEFGGILDIWRRGNWHVSIDASWGLDVDTRGNADQRLKAGLVLGTSF